MFESRKIVLLDIAIVLFCAMAAIVSAQNAGISPHPVDPMVLGEAEVKQLLLLMDADRNGKISKQEFMRFMEQEFDRLDKDKSGELDVKELAQSKVRVSRFANAGK